MVNVRHHQQAQFRILEKMNSFCPSLTITREGYRSLTAVQISHRKTSSEGEWDDLKAKSWPPWKQERLGIDSDKTVESGISRAMRVLLRSAEAGYQHREWEEIAGVLSGWDIDGSPTIQTRNLLGQTLNHEPDLSGNFKYSSHSHVSNTGSFRMSQPAPGELLWAARVKATRTLDETWAQFLAFKDDMIPSTSTVYNAMLEKMLLESVRESRLDSPVEGSGDIPRPGESAMPLAPPIDPREGTFLHTRTPPTDNFIQSMVADGFEISDRCLTLFISQRSASESLALLSCGVLPEPMLEALVSEGCSSTVIKETLRPLHRTILTAIIAMFCHAALDSDNLIWVKQDGSRSQLTLHPFVHAQRLVTVVEPRNHGPWHALLSHVARSTKFIGMSCSDPRSLVPLKETRWEAGRSLVQKMASARVEPNLETVFLLCKLFLMTCLHDSRPSMTTDTTSREGCVAHPALRVSINSLETLEVSSGAVEEIKRLFTSLIGTDAVFTRAVGARNRSPQLLQQKSSSDSMKSGQLTAIPLPKHLYAMTRMLCVAKDYDGIQDLFEWMARWHEELDRVAKEVANGRLMIRRCFMAVQRCLSRACHEGDCDDGKVLVSASATEAAHSLDDIRNTVNGIQGWGGWPSDHEMEWFIHHRDQPIQEARGGVLMHFR